MYTDSQEAVIDTDIIIIGGGMSGMAAAFYLYENDPSLEAFVLEANKSIGGRTSSVPLRVDNSERYETFDAGAQFVSPQQLHLTDLLKKLDVDMCGTARTARGRVICDFTSGPFCATSGSFIGAHGLGARYELTTFLGKIEELSLSVGFRNPFSMLECRELDNLSVEDYITTNLSTEFARNLVRSVVKTACGANSSDVSVLFYVALCNSTNGVSNQFLTNGINYWIHGNAASICQRISSVLGSLYVKTNIEVKQVKRLEKYVIVETQNETYKCRYVIVAVPPPQALKIDFDPPLPQTKYDILEKLHVGHLTKFVAIYEKSFWHANGYSGEIRSYGKGPIYLCYDVSYDGRAALTGYTDASSQDENGEANSSKDSVLEQLANYFGYRALFPLEYFEKSWTNEAYICGCFFNVPRLGHMDKYHHLRRPNGRLYWAGTETSTYWNGYMAGAVQAGYRAAMEVLYDCRPQCLTAQHIAFLWPRQKQVTDHMDSGLAFVTSWKIVPIIAIVAGGCFIVYRNAKR